MQALRICTGRTAHRGSRGIALLFLGHGTRRGEGSGSRPGRSLHPGKTWYPLYRRLGGPQGQSGQVRNISLPPGFNPQAVQPVANRYTDYATRPTSTEGHNVISLMELYFNHSGNMTKAMRKKKHEMSRWRPMRPTNLRPLQIFLFTL